MGSAFDDFETYGGAFVLKATARTFYENGVPLWCNFKGTPT